MHNGVSVALDKDFEVKATGTVKCHSSLGGLLRIKYAVMTPNMNAVTEAFNSTLRRKCLNYFYCLSLAQINRIVSTYLRFYNTWRPHQGKGIDNKPLDKSFVPKATGTVICGSSLGGLLKWYYRDTG